MAPRQTKRKPPKLEATAKAKLTAEAVYKSEKKVLQVIPADVTRSRNAAWLDIISPLTEWAGLKGDQLRHKRSTIRVQQESTLLQVGLAARRLVDQRAGFFAPLPTKTLIPLLEKASLEHPDDQYMIECWAALLAGGNEKRSAHPRFVEILAMLTSEQARTLEELVLKPGQQSTDSAYDGLTRELDDREAAKVIGRLVGENGSASKRLLDDLLTTFNGRGLHVLHLAVSLRGHSINLPKITWGKAATFDLQIAESLVLVEMRDVFYASDSLEINIVYYQITNLGLRFLRACSENVSIELDKLETESRARAADTSDRTAP